MQQWEGYRDDAHEWHHYSQRRHDQDHDPHHDRHHDHHHDHHQQRRFFSHYNTYAYHGAAHYEDAGAAAAPEWGAAEAQHTYHDADYGYYEYTQHSDDRTRADAGDRGQSYSPEPGAADDGAVSPAPPF